MASEGADEDVVRSTYSPQEQLEKEIMELIAPYRGIDKKPPYSASELVLMALCCNDGPLTRGDVLEWIVQTFDFYGDLAKQQYLRHVDTVKDYNDEEEEDGRCAMVVKGWYGAWRDVELPLRGDEVLNERHEVYDDDDDHAEVEYTVSTSAARAYLVQHLGKERAGVFRFLDLAAELRNAVYELVFFYSEEPGIEVCSSGLLLRHRRHSTPTSLDDSREAAAKFKLPKMCKILALVATCKQIYKEALPVFYDHNSFIFAHRLRWNLKRIPSSHLKHITKLSVSMDSCSGLSQICGDFEDLVDTLAAIDHLKRIEITASDVWMIFGRGSRMVANRRTPCDRWSQLPRMKDLARILATVEEVHYHGDCPKLQEFISCEVEKIKARATRPKRQSEPGVKKRTAATNDQAAVRHPKKVA